MSVPLLRRIHRHSHTLWAPGLAVAVFTGLVGVSALVIGPAISGDAVRPTPSDSPSSPAPAPAPTDEHGH